MGTAPPNTTLTPTKPKLPQQSAAPIPNAPSTRASLMTTENLKAASKPFRSPLLKTGTRSDQLVNDNKTASMGNALAQDKRKIQALEKKLTTLKQAKKYRQDGCVYFNVISSDDVINAADLTICPPCVLFK
jgi:hypothetical protein